MLDFLFSGTLGEFSGMLYKISLTKLMVILFRAISVNRLTNIA